MAAAVECVVIGGGVVGLACARRAALSGLEVIVLEAASLIGSVTSARNSEVVHAGIYYPPGSNKAAFCVAGRELLYQYCDDHGVPYNKCGKLIVATNQAEVETLHSIKAKAEANGVMDLQQLTQEEARAMEPELECYAALLSPSTGIVDSHSYMLALQGDAEEHGAVVALESPVVGGSILPSGEILLEVGGEAPMELQCKHVINSAGLSAPWIARTILSDNGAGPAEMNAEAGNGGGGGGSGSGVTGMLDDAASALDIPGAYFAKGNYYALGCKAPFSRLVYPVPQQAGLGVHGTIDLGGAMRFGPDVEWIGCGTNSTLSNCDLDYTVDPARADSFYAEVRKYWPALPDDSLLPDYAGVRPKINAEGEAAADFVVWAGKDHTTFTTRDGCEMDLSGMVNLFGIESPGLTSSLAIADAAVGALDLPKDLAI